MDVFVLSSNELRFIIYGAVALFVLGALLSYLAFSQKQDSDLVISLEQALPGAQCAQCGYPGCKAYAEALAAGQASCDKCTPGGTDTTEALAQILGISVPVTVNDDDIFSPRSVAVIHQSLCTGCTKCKRHCPVDAIEGVVKNPHQVLTEECIGCEECVSKCPEKCIEMIRMDHTVANFNWELRAIRFKGINNSPL